MRAIFATSRMVLAGDETHYAESLHHFMRGDILGGLSDYWSFLYPFAAVPFGLIYGDAEAGLRLLSILSGAALVIPSMVIAKRLWGSRAALFAGLLIALHTNLLLYSAAAMTESFFSLLIMLALLSFLGAVRDGGRRGVMLAGLLLGLACLVRHEAQILLVVPLVFLLAGAGGHGPRRPAAARIVSSLLLVLFFVLPMIPHAFLIHEKTGRWFVQSKASVNLSSPLIWDEGLERERYVYTLNEDGTDRRINEIGSTNPIEIILNGKREIAGRYLRELADGAERLPPLLVTPFLLLLVPLGLFCRRWRSRAEELLLLAFGLFPFVLYPLFDMHLRYLVPYLPVLLMWGGAGCAALTGWIEENISRSRIVSAAALFVIFASLVPYSTHRYAMIRKGERLEYRQVGEWLGRHGGGTARIIAPPGTSYSYYAGNPIATFIPWTDAEGLHEYSIRMRFEYLVVGTDYLERYRPALLPLLEEPGRFGFELLEEFESGAGGKILVFRISPSLG